MNLKTLLEVPKNKPLVITLTGEPGAGKTTLACNFPTPVVIRVEDGLRAIPQEKRPHAFPLATKVDDVIDQLTMLIKEEHQFKTVIIDSVTQLNALFEKHVVDSDPRKKSTTTLASCLGGYGAGFQAVANLHQRIRNACQILNEKGMNIIFIAHYKVSEIELPDTDKFHRYQLDMHSKSESHYVNNVDVVAQIKQEVMIRKKEENNKAKAVTTGNRIIDCTLSPKHVSKNRLGIQEPIIFNINDNPFKEYL